MPAELLADTAATVPAYKSLAGLERAFRSIKTVDPSISRSDRTIIAAPPPTSFSSYSPICTWAAPGPNYCSTITTARPPLPPDPHEWPSPRSRPQPRTEAAGKHTPESRPVHSFRSLLPGLATLTRNLVRFGDAPPVVMLACPTALQQHTYDGLAIAIAP